MKTILICLLFSLSAYAQVGSDCSEQTKFAAENCQARIEAAKASDVGSYGDGVSGSQGSSTAQVAGLTAVRNAVTTAMTKCAAVDYEACKTQCSKAAQNPKMAASAQKNLKSCENKIRELLASGEETSRGLASAAAASSVSAKEVCEEGSTCGEAPEELQRAGMNNEPGMMNRRCIPGFCMNQCSGGCVRAEGSLGIGGSIQQPYKPGCITQCW